jgi:hypothetical protein
MPLHVTCEACGSRLKAPDEAAGRKVKCPKCGGSMLVPGSAVPPAPSPTRAPEREAVTERPTARKKSEAEVPPPTEPDEHEDEEAPAGERRPRRKKKRRRHKKRPEETSPAWVPWVTAGGIAFVILVAMGVISFVAWRQPLFVVYAVVFGVMLVVSTVILVISMFISSAIVGGMEFGEAHIVIPKAMGLLFVVNLIYLIPCMGPFLALPVWLIGCMLVFRLELWEARVLVAVNWVLGWIATWAVVALVISAFSHAGAGVGPGPGAGGGAAVPVPRGQQGTDAKAIQSLGGTYEVDENSPGTPVVEVDLSGKKVTDADLAHLKSFTKLESLDLSGTPITDAGLANLEGLSELKFVNLSGTGVSDAGLAHLKGLAKLEEVSVAKTKVTDAGVRELQKALPRARIVRKEE